MHQGKGTEEAVVGSPAVCGRWTPTISLLPWLQAGNPCWSWLWIHEHSGGGGDLARGFGRPLSPVFYLRSMDFTICPFDLLFPWEVEKSQLCFLFIFSLFIAGPVRRAWLAKGRKIITLISKHLGILEPLHLSVCAILYIKSTSSS